MAGEIVIEMWVAGTEIRCTLEVILVAVLLYVGGDTAGCVALRWR
jgi:hypothetical protein